MLEFLLLLLAHVLSDFYWQSSKWVEDKRSNAFKSKYFYAHVGLVMITSYVFLGHWNNPLPVILLG